MLQVKNLTKIYNANGVAVKALDDVSLSFGDSGMCFVLGKSGSGKSTFLNVCGGLDAPDSGEIIVKNRSSKDFTAKDFDSYRNTFIGFIFQEYNVLNEFSVEDNVMLALELQGKKKDKAVVDSILEKVDLKGLNKRKPNTLSGGQKQRVAIARALVKNPEIIMADEPSGALDSETGKQVFDTLKKLSRDKLVLVVSHDREFAEKYADRIIELKDGKVLSDVTKQVCEADEKENVSCINSNTLLVKRGRKLTEEDIEKIRHVVENSNSDVLITSDEKGVDEYKKNNDVTDASNGSFVETIQPQQRKYTDEESTFIRSTLPMRHAVRVGASGIKLKPVRFAFTLLLSIISFVMFGMLSCLMFYDSATVTANSLYDYGWDYIKMQQRYIERTWDSSDSESGKDINTYQISFSDYHADKFIDTFGEETLLVANLKVGAIIPLIPKNDVYTKNINGWVDASCKLDYIFGNAPGKNEIAISEYLYQSILTGKMGESSVTDYKDLTLTIGGAYDYNGSVDLKVSGVFKCDDVFKQWDGSSKLSDNQMAFVDSCRSDAFLNYAAINMADYEQLAEILGKVDDRTGYTSSSIFTEGAGAKVTMLKEELFEFNNIAKLPSGAIVYDINGKLTTSTDKALVLSPDRMYYFVINKLNEKIINMTLNDGMLLDKFEAFAYDEVPYSELAERMSDSSRRINGNQQLFVKDFGYFMSFIKENIPDLWALTDVSVVFDGTVIADKIYFSFDTMEDSMGATDYAKCVEMFKSGGKWRETSTNFDATTIKDAKYVNVFVKTDTKAKMQMLVDSEQLVNPDDTIYSIHNFVEAQIESIGSVVVMLSDVFFWIGLVMAVFSMLLLFNFITASIHAKRKEIGILRALGASGGDVFKIFLSESAIVVLVCSVVSTILTAVISVAINNNIGAKLGVPFSMFTFGIVSVAMIFGIAVVTAVISTFLPVWKNARKRPVEAIRQL